MIDFLFLVPISLALGAIGLVAFMWSLKAKQYEDLDGAAARILFEQTEQPICDSETLSEDANAARKRG